MNKYNCKQLSSDLSGTKLNYCEVIHRDCTAPRVHTYTSIHTHSPEGRKYVVHDLTFDLAVDQGEQPLENTGHLTGKTTF